MAGLLAARVLADGFETVTVVDGDPLPDEPVARDGVPQSNHIHALLEAGRATLEDLFPGYGEDLLGADGLLIEFGNDLRYYTHGDFLAPAPNRIPLYSATRPLIEAIVRRRVSNLEGVRLRGRCQFRDYLLDDAERAVVGVEVRDRETGRDERLASDLVVDATGRTSRTPAWLDDHGFSSPPVDEVTIDVAYSTVCVERPPEDRRAYLAGASVPGTRGGAAFPVEGDRWLVNLHGFHGDHPPSDPAALAEFARSLPVPHVAKLFEAHPMTSEAVHHYPFPSSLRRRYEKLDRFPEGLVVVGDAIASFNPIYAQGMSVAALEALQLHHALAAGGVENLGPRFFDMAEEVVDVAWKLAAGRDFQFPQTTGPRPGGSALLDRYLSRLIRTAHTDGRLAEQFVNVVMMEDPPTSLLHPVTVGRVLRPGGRARTGAGTNDPEGSWRVGSRET